MLEKNIIAGFVTARGHILIKQFNQCEYIFNDGIHDYGIIVSKKSKIGHMRVRNRLEHTVNKSNVENLQKLVGTILVVFLETQTGKILVGDLALVDKSRGSIKGCPVVSIARDSLSDLTPYLPRDPAEGMFSWQEICKKPLAETKRDKTSDSSTGKEAVTN